MSPWPHSPVHRLGHAGAYIVTAGTHEKAPLFSGAENLTFLSETLFTLAQTHSWRLQAWAVFPNHYHFVASSDQPTSLATFIRHLHSITAIELNKRTQKPGRKVWFQYWETHLSYAGSYLARLHYVHTNAVKHGLVARASLYPWCSAGWFKRRAALAFVRQVAMTKSDRINIADDFTVNPADVA